MHSNLKYYYQIKISGHSNVKIIMLLLAFKYIYIFFKVTIKKCLITNLPTRKIIQSITEIMYKQILLMRKAKKLIIIFFR